MATTAPTAPTPARKPVPMIYHVEEVPESGPPLSTSMHLIAGATAGVCEHVCMFPVDTVKTRLQSIQQPNYTGIVHALRTIARTESIGNLYRGITACVAGAIPSHALYFATYEAVKHRLSAGASSPQQQPNKLATGFAGIVATAVHDAVSTPLDMIKQRMQVHKSTHKSVSECARCIVRREGFPALYFSYPVTLLMNIPYTTVHFVMYESMKHYLFSHDHHDHDHDDEDDDHDHDEHDSAHHSAATWKHLTSGAVAGATAAAFSTPFDVIKTRLQTQGHFGIRHTGMFDVARGIWRKDGAKGFFRGMLARCIFTAPSAAITWGVYERVKFIYYRYFATPEELSKSSSTRPTTSGS